MAQDLHSFEIIHINDGFTAFSFIATLMRKESNERVLCGDYCTSVYKTQRIGDFRVPQCFRLENNQAFFLQYEGRTYFAKRQNRSIKCIEIPSLAQCSFGYSMYSFKFFQYQMTKEWIVRQKIPKILTLGGGWSCLQNSKKALPYTLSLYECAVRLHDQKLQRKSLLFLARNFLWSGDTKSARTVFSKLLTLASEMGDDGLVVQCHLGITECSQAQTKKTHQKLPWIVKHVVVEDANFVRAAL